MCAELKFTAIIESDGDRLLLTAPTDPPISVSGDSFQSLDEELQAKVRKAVAAGEVQILPPEPDTPWPPFSEDIMKVIRLACNCSDQTKLTRADIKSAASMLAANPEREVVFARAGELPCAPDAKRVVQELAALTRRGRSNLGAAQVLELIAHIENES